MVGLAIGDNGNHSFLISDNGEKEIRDFLRREGIRPSRPGFGYLLKKPLKRFAAYRLAGDEHLLIRNGRRAGKLRLPLITWGRLSLYILGGCSLGYLFHEELIP